MVSRREFGKIALAAFPAARALANTIDSRFGGVLIGAQTYSFRDMPLDGALDAMKEIGIGTCELYMGHVEPKGMRGEALKQWRLTTPMSYFEDIRRKFDAAGVNLFAYTLNFRDEFSDEEIDRGFQMTKALGTDIITTSTTLTCAKRLVAPAEKYKVRVALHGHDQTSKPNEFSTPETFAKGLEMSPLFYINLDIGHFFAAGYDPVDYLRQHHEKILVLHIKDRKKDHGVGTPFGAGDTPIKPVLLLLKENRWDMPADIEYEYNKPGLNTLVEVAKCFQYCKDALS